MDAEPDSLLAHIDDENEDEYRLGDAAETVSRGQDDLWTAQFTLVEVVFRCDGESPAR